jgi:hypothetical protein
MAGATTPPEQFERTPRAEMFAGFLFCRRVRHFLRASSSAMRMKR